jgi:hypothetical protein
VPGLIPEEVRASRSFATGIRRLAEQTGHRYRDVAELGWTYLQEMAAGHSRRAINLFERFGRLLMPAYTVEVDENKLNALRSVHVSVGDPRSLCAALGARIEGDGEARRHRVEKVALRCATGSVAPRRSHRPLWSRSPCSVPTTAHSRWGTSKPSSFIRYFERRKLAMTRDLAQPGELRHTLDRLSDNGVVARFDGGLEPVWGVSPDRRHDAAFYRNSIMHMLVDRAIVELVLAAAALWASSSATSRPLRRCLAGSPATLPACLSRGRVPARTAAELLASTDRVTPRLGAVRLALLVLHGGADVIATPAGARVVYEKTGSIDKHSMCRTVSTTRSSTNPRRTRSSTTS